MTLHDLYLNHCDKNKYLTDPNQEKIIEALQELPQSFVHRKNFLHTAQEALQFLWGQKKPLHIQGFYIHGQVGRGKTMLMDLFFQNVTQIRKKRMHFYAFMQEVHQRIRVLNASQSTDQPVFLMAKEFALHCQLLCLDEFQVNDIADAMILGRLFKALFQVGVIIVITANQPPQNLYLGGLHRERFLPFIELLMERLQIIELEGEIDYRRELLAQYPGYYSPLTPKTDESLHKLFLLLTNGTKSSPFYLEIHKRHWLIPKAANSVGWVQFKNVCKEAHGADDYLALSEAFKIIFITDIPQLTLDDVNETKRFITLIDILYDQRIHTIVSAAAPADQLYLKGPYLSVFERTTSRLIEMTSRSN
ncbi:MAG: cell division protein ZapE [Alphaproteobacteria bacterium]|nr:cell division protein ZapE [Alphaproteobacteria bacterium]